MGSAENYGPEGDESRHLSLEEIEKRWEALPPAGTDEGRVALIVARRADGVRETPESARLSPEEGVPGDRWARLTSDRPEMQLAVMRRDVAEILANGQPITHAGDNLFVDLDLSARNLPVGTRLEVGQAVVQVTPEPHDGCRKFMGRFGNPALRFISAKERRPENLRGVYWTVVEAGEVAVGDPIRVLERGTVATA